MLERRKKINPIDLTPEEREKVEWWCDHVIKHDTPSTDTLKMFKHMEKEIGEVKTSVVRIEGTVNTLAELFKIHKESVDELKEDFKKHSSNEDNFINQSKNEFAPKSIVSDVNNLKDTLEKRTYDWLKYLLYTIIGAVIAYYIKK